MIKLWIDDIRPAPKGWVWAKNASEAKTILKGEIVTIASFDHDLGMKITRHENGIDIAQENLHEETGYDIIKWMTEHNIWPTHAISFHTNNPVGLKNMMGTVERYGPYPDRSGLTFYNRDTIGEV